MAQERVRNRYCSSNPQTGHRSLKMVPATFSGPISTVSPAAGSITVWSCDMKLLSSMRVIMGLDRIVADLAFHWFCCG